MSKISHRVAATIAGVAVAIGLGAGVAHADRSNPAPKKWHGCVMYNGTVLADGESYTTSNGQTITCIDGFICRTLKDGTSRPCEIEAGVTPPARVASLAG
jgi:hypothetical protein